VRVYQNKRVGTIPASIDTEFLGFDVSLGAHHDS
ncbi:DUF3173 family protein, partial [Streptococcus suis]